MTTASYSSIGTFGRCPRLYKYRYVDNLEPIKTATPLYFGSTVHTLLEALYRDGEVKSVGEGLIEQVLNDTVIFDDEKNEQLDLIGEAAALVNNYRDQYFDEDNWEVLHVEEEFSCEIDGKTITFTPDLIVRAADGVWIVDHKTTSASRPDSLDPEFADLQALLYYTGVQQAYPDVRGFVFNYLRKKLPTTPRLTKTGDLRVANLDRIDTTYTALRDFLKAEAPALLDDPAHARRLAELRDRNQFFWRTSIYVDPGVADNLLDDVSALVGSIEASTTSGKFPRVLARGYDGCQRCPFRAPCEAALLGWDETQILEDYYKEKEER